MAWIAIPETVDWEYSNAPNTDKRSKNTYDYDLDSGHVLGIRTRIVDGNTTEVYVLCRQVTAVGTLKVPGAGFGEINKTALEG